LRTPSRWPTIGRKLSWRIGHHNQAAHLEKWCGTLSSYRRRTKSARYDQIVRAAQFLIATGGLRAKTHDIHTIRPPETRDGLLECVCASGASVKQGHG
jgi:hypothetical protein